MNKVPTKNAMAGVKPVQNPTKNWFLTNAGRRFTLGAAVVAGATTFCMHYVPNTFLLDKYKQFYQMFRGVSEVEVEPYIAKLGEEVMDKLGFHRNDKQLYRYFTAYGFDALHLGSTFSKYGVLVGVPSNFYFKSKADIEYNNITVQGEPIKQKSTPEDKDQLLDSLILSDKAKQFALGVQIYEANTAEIFNQSIAPSASIVAYYTLSTHFNQKFNGYARPVSYRAFMYTMIGAFVTGVYYCLREVSTHAMEKQADRKVAKLGLEHAEGGVEYYSKILQRNKVLRRVMGSKGESLFTVSGDVESLVFTPHVPITQRLISCKKIVEELNANPGLAKVTKAPEKSSKRLSPMFMGSNTEEVQSEMNKMNK
ncbi:transmembrane protein 177 isoform X1 [Cloeon dipterum]|uniref:transmembrane protein 177 isoform X1 n=2 Tax=Cloeon dipterum TaxID=197152 RepID=UPI00321FC721